jgi:F0F1-type ATP synthase membrane subunit c/vacuolar-type H+-ATPase subunit K
VFEEELFTSIRQLYPKLGPKEHQTKTEESAKEAFRAAMERMQRDPIYTKENRDGVIKESKEFRLLTVRWGVFSLIMYMAGLSYSILALLLIEAIEANPDDLFISLFLGVLFYSILCIIVLNISMLIQFWYMGQHMMNTYRDSMMKIQDYADSEIGKLIIEVNKMINEDTKK